MPSPEDRIKALEARINSQNARIEALRAKYARAVLHHAAAEAGFIDPGDGATLMRLAVAFDGDEIHFVTPEGKARYNRTGDPLTPAEMAAEILAQRPFLRNPGGGMAPSQERDPQAGTRAERTPYQASQVLANAFKKAGWGKRDGRS